MEKDRIDRVTEALFSPMPGDDHFRAIWSRSSTEDRLKDCGCYLATTEGDGRLCPDRLRCKIEKVRRAAWQALIKSS